MTHTASSPASFSFCTYLTPSGRQCRQQAVPGIALCSRHAAPQFTSRNPADFRKRLTADCDEFTTATGIHNSLSELYKLLAADLITARRAAVLAYIANLLLRTIPLAQKEVNPDEPHVIVDFGDLPRPDRSSLPITTNQGTFSPSPAYPSSTTPTVPLCTEKVCP